MSATREPSPLILYGAPRSGTTYLQQVLNHHSAIHLTPETRLFVWAHRSLVELTEDEKALHAHQQPFVDHLRKWYPKMIREFYDTLGTPTTRFWGDKNPHYTDSAAYLRTIVNLFPGTRFIHLIRDGRDVVTSLYRKGWVSFQTAHRMWTHNVNIGDVFGQAQPDGCYLELRYEDLIEDDVKAATRILDFLGLRMESELRRFCEAQKVEREPFSEPTRDLAAGAGRSTWAATFDLKERRKSLDLLGPQLLKYGYETETALAEQRRRLKAEDDLEDRLQRVIRKHTPPDAVVAVVSKGDDSLLAFDGRVGWHFPLSPAGGYAGHHPADSAEAVAQLEEVRHRGAGFLLFPKDARWWLEHYPGLRSHLEKLYTAVTSSNDEFVLFDLMERAAQEGLRP
jgi:hypothetical protein